MSSSDKIRSSNVLGCCCLHCLWFPMLPKAHFLRNILYFQEQKLLKCIRYAGKCKNIYLSRRLKAAPSANNTLAEMLPSVRRSLQSASLKEAACNPNAVMISQFLPSYRARAGFCYSVRCRYDFSGIASVSDCNTFRYVSHLPMNFHSAAKLGMNVSSTSTASKTDHSLQSVSNIPAATCWLCLAP